MKVTRFTYPLIGGFVAVLLGVVAVGADIINPPPMGQIKGNLTTRSGDTIGFSSSATDPSVACDTCLNRDSADTLALRRGTNRQLFLIYGTYTDASNFEALQFGPQASADFRLNVRAVGTGSQRDLRFDSSGSEIWRMKFSSGGHLLPGADNTYNIGSASLGIKTVFTNNLDITTGGSTSIGAGVGSVKMTSGNAATNAAWIPLQLAGTVYYVPGWTTNNP